MKTGCAIDREAEDDDWISVKRLAAIRGVSHQAISKRAAFFMRKGLLQTRRVGKEKLVHRPTFDTLAAASHDPAQDLRLRHVKGEPPAEPLDEPASEADRGEPPAPLGLPGQSAYDDASAREKNAKAAIAEMELARRRAELVPARELGDVAALVGTTIAQQLAALKGLSGKLYAAANTSGEDGVRIILIGEVDRVVNAVRDDLLNLAAGEPIEPPARPN